MVKKRYLDKKTSIFRGIRGLWFRDDTKKTNFKNFDKIVLNR